MLRCVLFAPRVDWIDEHYADDVCLENPGLAMLASVLRSSGCVAEVYDGNLQNMRSCADILSRLPGVAVLGLSPDSSVLPEVIAWLPEVRSKFPALAIAVKMGSEALARLVSKRLPDAGLLANLVEYPAVGKGAARFRMQVMANHSPENIRSAVDIIAHCYAEASEQLKGVEMQPMSAVA